MPQLPSALLNRLAAAPSTPPVDIPGVTGPRVLGLDLSLRATGWCQLAGDGELVAWGTIRHPGLKGKGRGGREGGERILWIVDAVMGKVGIHGPSHVGIEDYILGTVNVRTTVELGELGGAVKMELARRGLDWGLWTPGGWKKELWGKGRGNMKKVEVKEMVEEGWGVEVEDLDRLEAWCVAEAERRRRIREGGRGRK